MECRRCGATLERPGDYCLRCHTANADATVLEIGADRAVVTPIVDDVALEPTVVTTVPETAPRARSAERRNFAGRLVDELLRRRPEAVYAAGDRSVIRRVREQVPAAFYRVDGNDPVAGVLDSGSSSSLEVVDRDPSAKIGGRHSTLIGGRRGMAAIRLVAAHPNVKKVVPGPIDAGGAGSRSGLRAKVTRSDANGNLRLLLRDGASVQENRLVTTAAHRRDGERVRAALNEALDDEGFR